MPRASKASKAAKKSKAARKTATGGVKKTARGNKTTKTSRASTRTTETAKKAAKRVTSKRTNKSTAKKAAADKNAAKKATPRRSRKAKSPFDTRFLEQMRKLLRAERETYDRQATLLKAEADSLVADIEPGDVQFDEESGEGDTIAVERGRDLALSAKAREMIEEIDHALAKLDDGTYGICEISGEPIPRERLEAIPWARERVEYKVGGFGRR